MTDGREFARIVTRLAAITGELSADEQRQVWELVLFGRKAGTPKITAATIELKGLIEEVRAASARRIAGSGCDAA